MREKRRVLVTITSFHGLGHHFHVELREESRETNREGLRRFMKFADRRRAQRWVDYVWQRNFSPETHELVVDHGAGSRWFYGEGD
jgi:hypothetical protein